MQQGSSYVNQGSATQLNSTKAYCGKVHKSIFTWPLSGHALHVYILKFDLDIKRSTKIKFIIHQKSEKNHTKKVIYNNLQHNYWIIIVSHSNNLHLFMLDPYTSLPLWIISQDLFSKKIRTNFLPKLCCRNLRQPITWQFIWPFVWILLT